MAGPIEIKPSGFVCCRCGKSYGTRRNTFPVNYGELYKGAGYLPWCDTCVDEKYNYYLRTCGEQKSAVRQLCRKLDLYWNEALYESAAAQSGSHSIVSKYMFRLCRNKQYIGKSFDDTLIEAGTLWDDMTVARVAADSSSANATDEEDIEVSDDIKNRFGPGYTNQMYLELDERFRYWMDLLPPEVDKNDIGVQALMQQLCAVDLDIIKQRVSGQSADKNMKIYNDILASLGLRPTQKKDEDAETAMAKIPLGVWLYRYEKKRPLPELPDDLKANRLLKYVFIWMGHILKMVGSKVGFTKMYEEEMTRLRVQRPDFAEDDDETVINESYIANLYEEHISDESKEDSA